MTTAEDAINTLLTIDYGDTPSDNWDDYTASYGDNSDRDTVRVALEEDVGPNPSISQSDWIIIKELDPVPTHPTTFLDIIEVTQVVRLDIRSTGKSRGNNLKDEVFSILGSNLSNLSSPWSYMEFVNIGVNQSKGKMYRYIVEVRLYNIHQNVTS